MRSVGVFVAIGLAVGEQRGYDACAGARHHPFSPPSLPPSPTPFHLLFACLMIPWYPLMLDSVRSFSMDWTVHQAS